VLSYFSLDKTQWEVLSAVGMEKAQTKCSQLSLGQMLRFYHSISL